MALIEEINDARMQVHADSYPMSIGELVNLYIDEELEIHPEFQRVYRWTEEQKSKLIESILLGIPLPSIFVSQRQDGVWDVVDGLQRLSTIFSFMGELKDENGNKLPPLELKSTKYLPSLSGKAWNKPSDIDNELDLDIKRVFKREKIDIKIIKRESQDDTKFELFQRLNTGGTKLSDQEVRNCMLLMINSEAFNWLQEISKNEDFITTTPISSRLEQERYNQELVLRFIVQRNYSEKLRKAHSDLGPYLDAELNRIFNKQSPVIDYEEEQLIFEKTFYVLNNALEDNAFKKYNNEKNRLEGPISIPVYEALSTGVSFYIENNKNYIEKDLVNIIKSASTEISSHHDFTATLEKNIRPLDRMVAMINLGKELIK
ncbi:TPA: DUF262 domain-containing protein [Morganella morganii]|uniref:DUF262 domain-containing protein n=1 Tax=Morganella morganii TaxID=582 RepID=UPI001C8B9FE4|nr:DUF262 domain-containing protein [Morganella morganii]HEI8864071.1 DUF262 domain-containing protein [Morganella morganii]